VISFVALWLAFRLRDDSSSAGWRKSLAALVMGAAIPAMHYVGMEAASFTRSASIDGSLSHALSIFVSGHDGHYRRHLYGSGASPC
jgi:two-component system, sensor histidine kinase and response regulator